MRSVWEECTADTGTPEPPADPEEAERNEVAELSRSKFEENTYYILKLYTTKYYR